MMCWEDDFSDGLVPTDPKARWSFLDEGSYVTDDGIISTSDEGLHVISSGVNPRTGEAAFVNTLGQDDGSGSGVSGADDRLKWLVLANHQASSGSSGFDAVPGQELICETWMSGRTYGTEEHPFGRQVTNPAGDPRLATVAIFALDSESGALFEFAVTNDQVYVFYEQLPWQRASRGMNYAAFMYAIPVVSCSPGDRHHFVISYDRAAGVVRWLLDDKEVYRVDRLGCLLPSREHMILDHGGEESLVQPRQLNCGMGLFSYLDGSLPGCPGSGLVRLSGAGSFYFDPATGAPDPQVFLDDKSLKSNRLFGQGAELRISRVVVRSVPAT